MNETIKPDAMVEAGYKGWPNCNRSASEILRSIAEEREADASPDLLEALQELAMIVERAFPALKHNPILLKADAAISKATGAA